VREGEFRLAAPHPGVSLREVTNTFRAVIGLDGEVEMHVAL
jgi:hypothetical protein